MSIFDLSDPPPPTPLLPTQAWYHLQFRGEAVAEGLRHAKRRPPLLRDPPWDGGDERRGPRLLQV